MRRLAARTSLFTVATLVLATGLFAAKKDRELSIQVRGEDGAELSFSISADFVEGLLEGLAGADADCEMTTDEDTRAMLEHLDRRGEGSKYRFRDDEGKWVTARRRRGQLELDIARSGKKDAHVSMPWGMAECMLGHRVEVSHDARAEFAVEGDGELRIRIE